MFEDATFESQNRIHTRSGNWMLATLLLNSAILIALILIPLIYPDALPRQWQTHSLAAPPPPAAAAPAATHAQAQQSAAPRPIEVPLLNTQRQLRIEPSGPAAPGAPSDANPCFGCNPIGPQNGTIGGDPLKGITPQPTPHVVKPPSAPIPISKGVAEGMLIQRIMPAYPPVAKAAHSEGTVVLQATISKSGAIEGLRVIEGPPMLRQAALNAVAQWRYRPYLLNGDPVEVETTINVVFSMDR